MGVAFEAKAESGGGFAMAGEAESAEVFEIALAAAFGYGEDVVGVPEGAAGVDGFQAIEGEAGGAGGASGALEGGVDGDGVGLAEGAEASVAGEDAVAEIAGVGAEAMLLDAVVGAEGAAAAGEDPRGRTSGRGGDRWGRGRAGWGRCGRRGGCGRGAWVELRIVGR